MAQSAAAAGAQKQADDTPMLQQKKQDVIPITEASDGSNRKVPKAVFIEDVEAWVEKYGDDPLFQQMQELYQKYKFMETSFLRERQNLRTKLPDIKKTLEMVALLKQKHEGDEKAIETNFLISDNVWSKAKIPNDTGRVGLWLGANVMVEYSHMDALVLLGKNLANAEAKLAELDSSIDFLKDQITTTEVNIARVYNQGVKNKSDADLKNLGPPVMA